MKALRIAILDEQLAAQLDERDGPLEHIEVAWVGTDVERFREEVPRLRPDALIVDLALLGDDPVRKADVLVEQTGAQMLLVVYTFARRELISELTAHRARAVRSPVSLDSLRGFLSGLMVRKILGNLEEDPAAPVDPEALPGKALVPDRVVAKMVEPRFSMAQLGRLKEIDSAVECECPANLADLLTQLASFERYSAGCENRNEKDAEIHHMLFQETGKARAIMEDALLRLMAHENIKL